MVEVKNIHCTRGKKYFEKGAGAKTNCIFDKYTNLN